MQNQNLVETLTIYIRIVFKKLGQDDLASDEFIKELLNKIFTEIFEKLIQQKVPAAEQEQFAKQFIENAQSNLNGFFDQLAKLIRSDELQRMAVEMTNKELQSILLKLKEDGEIQDQDLERLEWFLKNPTEFQAMDKLLKANSPTQTNKPEDVLQNLSGI